MNKNKIFLFLIFLFLVVTKNKAQILSPEVVSSSGETFINNSTIVDFSIGEIVIETYTSSSKILTQGFNQPDLNGTDDIQELDINISLFPNPTNSDLNIILSKAINAKIIIKDVKGRVVFSEESKNQKQFSYNLDFLNPATYYLSIENGSKQNTYEIQIF